MHIPLAARYRPKDLKSVVGHYHYVKIIDFIIKNNKISPAYLFTGHHGTGKTSLARIISRTINCLSPNLDNELIEPCNICRSCIQKMHPDIMEIDAASNTGVDNIRSLIETAEYVPIIGKYKVFIIDEVHMLSKSAFNAFLKTLEEPKSHLLFILATTEPEKLPLTVISRCQRFDLQSVSSNDISKLLKEILNEHNVKFDQTSVNLLAKKAGGSIRDSLMYLEQILNFLESSNQGHLNILIVQNILNVRSEFEILTLLKFILSPDYSKVLNILENVTDFDRLIADISHGLAILAKFILVFDISELKSELKIDLQLIFEDLKMKFTHAPSSKSNQSIDNSNKSNNDSPNQSEEIKEIILSAINTAWEKLSQYKLSKKSSESQKDYATMILFMIMNQFYSPILRSTVNAAFLKYPINHLMNNVNSNNESFISEKTFKLKSASKVPDQFVNEHKINDALHAIKSKSTPYFSDQLVSDHKINDESGLLKSKSTPYFSDQLASEHKINTKLGLIDENNIKPQEILKSKLISENNIRPQETLIDASIKKHLFELIKILNTKFEAYYFLMNHCSVDYIDNCYVINFKEASAQILNTIDDAVKSIGKICKYNIKIEIVSLKSQLIKHFETTKLFQELNKQFKSKVLDVIFTV